MKIDGMDASSTINLNVQSFNTQPTNIQPISEAEVKDSKTKLQTTNSTNENKMISQIPEYELKELPVPDKLMIDAINKANKAILGGNRRFEFSVHDKTKQISVKVIDSDTNEVIREIPSEKTLDMVAKLWEMSGIMVDERR